VWDCRHRGNLELAGVVVLDVKPEYHASLPLRYLVGDLFREVCDGVGSSTDLWGPRSMAAWISSRIQSRPDCVGHPNFAQSASKSAASCFCASPCGAISLYSAVFVRCSQCSLPKNVFPSCRTHCPLIGCSRKVALWSSLFCFRSCFVVALVAIFPVVLMMGGSSSVYPPPSSSCGTAAVVLSTLLSMSLSP
jgi:hypothetical protein